MLCIKKGHRPQEMEDKWFMYCECEKLFIHRSWSGYCIYIVDLSENEVLKVTVNRNPEQYTEKNIENDISLINILINILVGRKSENIKLMKDYIENRSTEK